MKVKKEANPKAKKYVTNADLMPALMEAKELGELTPKLAKMLHLIAERYSFHPWFKNYSFREDMVSEATVNLCKNWYKFDETKGSNPFSYWTTACYRSFLSYLDHERGQRDIKDELLVQAGANPSWSYNQRMAGSDAAFTTVEE